MFQFPVLIAATAEKASMLDALPHLMGFVVVIVTLASLWLICAIIGKVITAVHPSASATARPVTSAPISAKPADGTVPPEVIVAIAAAVTATVGASRRVVSVQPYNPAWTQAGRQVILTSHKVR